MSNRVLLYFFLVQLRYIMKKKTQKTVKRNQKNSRIEIFWNFICISDGKKEYKFQGKAPHLAKKASISVFHTAKTKKLLNFLFSQIWEKRGSDEKMKLVHPISVKKFEIILTLFYKIEKIFIKLRLKKIFSIFCFFYFFEKKFIMQQNFLPTFYFM